MPVRSKNDCYISPFRSGRYPITGWMVSKGNKTLWCALSGDTNSEIINLLRVEHWLLASIFALTLNDLFMAKTLYSSWKEIPKFDTKLFTFSFIRAENISKKKAVKLNFTNGEPTLFEHDCWSAMFVIRRNLCYISKFIQTHFPLWELLKFRDYSTEKYNKSSGAIKWLKSVWPDCCRTLYLNDCAETK